MMKVLSEMNSNRIIDPDPRYTGYSVPDLNAYVGRGFTLAVQPIRQHPLPPDLRSKLLRPVVTFTVKIPPVKGLFSFDVTLDNRVINMCL